MVVIVFGLLPMRKITLNSTNIVVCVYRTKKGDWLLLHVKLMQCIICWKKTCSYETVRDVLKYISYLRMGEHTVGRPVLEKT